MSARRLSQFAVAEILGISPSTFSRALRSNTISAEVRVRVLHHFPELAVVIAAGGGRQTSATAQENLEQILHLLHETDSLLEGIKSRVVSLADVVQGGI